MGLMSPLPSDTVHRNRFRGHWRHPLCWFRHVPDWHSFDTYGAQVFLISCKRCHRPLHGSHAAVGGC